MTRHTSQSPYTCPRCGYYSDRLSSMKNHLYKKSKPCPGTINNITLTSDIKEFIILNRTWNCEEIIIPTKTINNTYITISNNFLETLNKYQTFNQFSTIPFNFKIESYASKVREELESNIIQPNFITSVLQNTLEHATTILDDNIEHLNIHLDIETQTLFIFDDDDYAWKTYQTNNIISILMKYVQRDLLHDYEKCLIRCIYLNPNNTINESNELNDLYNFLHFLDLYPYIVEHENVDFISEEWISEFVANDIIIKYTNLFESVKLERPKFENLYKEFITILSTNSKSNIEKIDKLIQNDQKFLKLFVEQ